MNPDNVVDNAHGLSYNEPNDLYDRVAENILSQPQVVKMDEQKPLNDTNCKHETLVADPDDKIGDAIFHSCSNHKCGVGFYIQPTIK
jgi:hypothetical protein